MNRLKCYVGLDNKFVLCQKFPDDEDHAGLHDMLQDFLDYDDVIADTPMEQGFYELEFEIDCKHYTDPTEQDAWLVIKNIKKINTDFKRLSCKHCRALGEFESFGMPFICTHED